MTMIPDANSILMSGGGKFATFKEPGDTITGVIVDVGTPYHVKEFNQVTQRSDGPPRYTKSGKPVYAFHLTLTTTERRPEDPEDDGTRVVDVNSWRMQDALRGAVRNAAAKGLTPGAQVTLTYIGDEVPGDKRSGKKFTAEYVSAANTTLMGAPAVAPAEEWATPAPAPAAATPAGDSPAVKAQKLIDAGMTDQQINQVTGLDLAVIAAIRGNSDNTPF